MNVRCQWLLTARVRNHIRSHVGQHFHAGWRIRRSRSKSGASQLIAKFRCARSLRRQKNGDFKVGFDLVEEDDEYRSRFQKEGSADALLRAARVTRTVPLLPLQPVLAECAHRL